MESESLKRWNKMSKSVYEKKETIKRLKEKGLLSLEKKSPEWIKEKTGLWRNRRDFSTKSPNRDDTVNASNGRFDIRESVEELEENIVKIGRSVRIKLKETVFRESFIDLKRQDYLRDFSPDHELNYLFDENPLQIEFSTELGEIPSQPKSLDSVKCEDMSNFLLKPRSELGVIPQKEPTEIPPQSVSEVNSRSQSVETDAYSKESLVNNDLTG